LALSCHSHFPARQSSCSSPPPLVLCLHFPSFVRSTRCPESNRPTVRRFRFSPPSTLGFSNPHGLPSPLTLVFLFVRELRGSLCFSVLGCCSRVRAFCVALCLFSLCVFLFLKLQSSFFFFSYSSPAGFLAIVPVLSAMVEPSLQSFGISYR